MTTPEEQLAELEQIKAEQAQLRLALGELAHLASGGMFGGTRLRYPALAVFAREHEERRRLEMAAAGERKRAERAAENARRTAVA